MCSIFEFSRLLCKRLVCCIAFWRARGEVHSREGNGIDAELFGYLLYGNADNFKGMFLTIYYLISFVCIPFAVVFMEVIQNIWNYIF